MSQNSQERGKERAEKAYPDYSTSWKMGYERGYNDAMAEPREWSDAAVEAAAEAWWFSIDDGVPRNEIAGWPEVNEKCKADLRREVRVALQAADKAERERVQHE